MSFVFQMRVEIIRNDGDVSDNSITSLEEGDSTVIPTDMDTINVKRGWVGHCILYIVYYHNILFRSALPNRSASIRKAYSLIIPLRSTPFNYPLDKTLIARCMGPTWGPPGADRTQVGPMLALWTLLSGNCNSCVPFSGLAPGAFNREIMVFA